MALRVTDGDFRDWDAIDTWGAQIANELSEATAQCEHRRPKKEVK